MRRVLTDEESIDALVAAAPPFSAESEQIIAPVLGAIRREMVAARMAAKSAPTRSADLPAVDHDAKAVA